ncbi:GntR family transcriptional regulator [Streptomyces sp. NPDC058459]|uniref:GntR family transcriptional regulator n=1 Tax=Streptomyces sp. NPDC058459 TaxID=3346508 RepID=UPI0036484F91
MVASRGIQLSLDSDRPVYRQIVSQLSFMIETGDLAAGATLPSARLLADNLHVNRNTVARAYGELQRLGLVESRGRGGTVVADRGPAPPASPARERARDILGAAVRECVALGLSAAEIRTITGALALRVEDQSLSVGFVECNADRATYFAGELESRIGLRVKPLVLGGFSAGEERADLILTTFFHLAAVRGLWNRETTEVVAIVVAPHVRTLVEIASVPKNRTVGIWYSTDDQAVSIRDSLAQSGIDNIKVLGDAATGELDDADIADTDLVIVPSEMPQLRKRLEGRVKVIEFGNVLDDASVRMVTEVVADMQAAKRDGITD